MILHITRMRRNVNRNVFNSWKNVSATPVLLFSCVTRDNGAVGLSCAGRSLDKLVTAVTISYNATRTRYIIIYCLVVNIFKKIGKAN